MTRRVTTIHQRPMGLWLLGAVFVLPACGDDAAEPAQDAATSPDGRTMRDADPAPDAGGDAAEDARSPEPDASTDDGSVMVPDGGAGDAGAGDAGAEDGGGDGGGVIVVPDAGSADAAAGDGGVEDASAGDADSGDADTGDADSGDADAGDASTGDAGTCPEGPSDFGAGCFSNEECSSGICWMSPLVAGGCQTAGCSAPCETDHECRCRAAEAGASDPDQASCVSGSCDLTDTGLGQVLLCS